MINHLSSVVVVGLCSICQSLHAEPSQESELGIDFVTVSDPGNLAYKNGFGVDPDGRGSVPYVFRISRTEITCGQYLEFFNNFYQDAEQFFTLLPRGDTSFFWEGPGVPLRFANGFEQPESVGVQLNWRQAAMFCNWMHNGQTDEWESVLDGAYDTSTFTREPNFGDFNDQTARHPDARYWIPSLDEHLKAAYYDPDKNGNGPGWWEYGHSSDDEIVNGLPGVGETARDVPSQILSDLFGPATDPSTIPLGIYMDVQSPWGLLDVHGGNEEWLEDWESGERRSRVVRESSNTSHLTWGTISDRIWFLWSELPTSVRCGVRIASLLPHPADLNRDWRLNFFDVSVFIQLYLDGDECADFDHDGQIGPGDVFEFVNTYQN